MFPFLFGLAVVVLLCVPVYIVKNRVRATLGLLALGAVLMVFALAVACADLRRDAQKTFISRNK